MYNDRKRGKSGLPAQKRQVNVAHRQYSIDNEPIVKRVLTSALLGVLVSVISGGVLLTLLCFLALKSEDPLSLISPLSLLALLPANFLGGVISSKKADRSPMACGAICAAMWLLLSLVVAVCLPYPSSNHALWQSILLHVVSVMFCILGAFAGTYKPRRNTRKRHRFGGK